MMDGMRRLLLAALVALFVACTGSPSGSSPAAGATGIAATASTASSEPGATVEPGSSPGPGATPPTSDAPLAAPDLHYRLLEQLARPLFCHPDFYPNARPRESHPPQPPPPGPRPPA